jgi:hypothetical protein
MDGYGSNWKTNGRSDREGNATTRTISVSRAGSPPLSPADGSIWARMSGLDRIEVMSECTRLNEELERYGISNINRQSVQSIENSSALRFNINSPSAIRPAIQLYTPILVRIELTIQGRGHSTTDDSSTLPSHQEESEGCE